MGIFLSVGRQFTANHSNMVFYRVETVKKKLGVRRSVKLAANTLFISLQHGGMALLFWVCSLLVGGSLAAQPVNLRRDLERYTPFPITETQELAQDLDFDPRGVADTLTARLSQFYLSDPSRKKIEQRQLLDGDENLYVREWNVNIQRLFLRDLLAQPQSSFLIKEAPNISLMHATLARALLRQRKPYHAAYHFAAALQYRSLRMDPEVFINSDRLALLEPNNPQIAAARQYADARRELEEARAELKRVQREIYAAEDNLIAKQAPASDEALRRQQEENRRLLQDQLAQNRNLLQRQQGRVSELEIRMKEQEQNFERFAVEYNAESSRLLVETAELVRQLEDAIKERQKIVNKKVLYKTEFNQTLLHDYSQNRQFAAYANLLEAASRLDERNPQIPFKLGVEYASSQDIRRAIYAYEKALEAQAKAPPELKLEVRQLYDLQVALGSLYFQANRMVDSAYFYEQALLIAPDENARSNLTYQVARFHIERTGNYRRGIELLKPYKATLLQMNPTDMVGRLNWVKQRFLVSRLLANANEKIGDEKGLLLELQAAIDAHGDLEQMIASQRQEVESLFKEVQEAKKPLLNETRMAEFNEFRRLEERHQAQQLALKEMLALRNSLPLGKVYFQLASARRAENDIAGALAIYQQAELLGLMPDEARRLAEELRRQFR